MRKSESIHHGAGKHAGGGRRQYSIHETPDVSYISNPDVAHEHTDVTVKPIAWFVFGLFVFGLVAAGLMWLLFNYFDKRERAAEPPASPLARRGDERLPPEPRLQLAPGFGVRLEDGRTVDLSQTSEKPELRVPQAEYREVLAQWQRELNGYEWVDQNAGTVRLPIEQAKQLFLQRQQQEGQK